MFADVTVNLVNVLVVLGCIAVLLYIFNRFRG